MNNPSHNDLLNRIPKPTTLRTLCNVALGWLAVIALAAMGGVSFLSNN